MTRTGRRDPWARFDPPPAPGGLRERVLAASRPVAAACPAAMRADRIWFSRRWRLAWVATLLAFAALEAVVGRRHAGDRDRSPAAPGAAHEADAAAVALGLAPGGWLGARVASGEARSDLTLEDIP